MKFYRVEKNSWEHNNEGYEWFLSAREAKKCKREFDEPPDPVYPNSPECEATIEVVNIQCNKEGVLWALNNYASYPNNG
mgnify:CR=1 FL=1